MSATHAIARRLGGALAAYGDIIRSRSYFPLWLGQLLSSFGDTLHYIALVVLVFRLSGQGLAVAGVVAAEVVPVLVLAPAAGVIIDRFSRKAVLIGADLLRAALVASLIWPQGVWHAYLVAAGLAAGNTFFNPAVQAVIPVLTTEDQRLAANSVAWSTGRLVQILASAVAGGIIALVGTEVAFAMNAASFAVSTLLLARLAIPAHAGQLGEGTKRGLVATSRMRGTASPSCCATGSSRACSRCRRSLPSPSAGPGRCSSCSPSGTFASPLRASPG